MKLQLWRHATVLLQINDLRILVDPYLADKDVFPPIPNTGNTNRNPGTALPFSDEVLQEQLGQLDAVIVTHLHPDHWDTAAQERVPKHLPLFCQPEDEQTLISQGFQQVIPVSQELSWQGIRITRTSGQHGKGEIGKLMAPVSGFVLDNGEDKLYIAGDTIWCEEVAAALADLRPQFVVVNAGAAAFIQGGAITMTADDVKEVIEAAGVQKTVAVHMDTVNHCFLLRKDLKAYLQENGLTGKCLVPEDGEWLSL
ncbi:MBL fold metallo-hydrolase [Chitinophaga pendula]|uniref:MBL fold metallo-hydrolase n=1 Tax=Chitinophaga TaxID=79328 RepID=UPI000BAF0408|nr:MULTISPECIES: MBL fold metallo-hydrolase [Chitinophaga]ASZ13395.1 hypothetical protein CK934_21735 [Chitinophaga sp. MD30]UCJ08981.1 MBL fold metallo-hydrolase [Chitinophaga pendula]